MARHDGDKTEQDESEGNGIGEVRKDEDKGYATPPLLIDLNPFPSRAKSLSVTNATFDAPQAPAFRLAIQGHTTPTAPWAFLLLPPSLPPLQHTAITRALSPP